MKTRTVLLLIICILLTGCTSADIKESRIKLKNDYEALNNQKDKYGYDYNKVELPEDNPFIVVDIDKVLSMCEQQKTFILYVDTPSNQWGRTFIDVISEEALKSKVDIYYLDLTNDRDEIKYNNKTTAIVNNGTLKYQYLLDYLKETLPHYMLYDAMGDMYPAGEGRIYDGNLYYIYRGNGKFSQYPRDTLQFEYTDELTPEIKEEQRILVKAFIDETKKG